MRALLIAAFFVFSSPLAADHASSIADARGRIASGDCRGAARTLEDEIGPAGAIAADAEREAALSAVHFYAAVAYSDCRQEPKAREHLKEFFRLHPGQSSLDPAKFDARFIRLFNSLQDPASHATFDRFYPGFQKVEVPLRKSTLMLWGATSEFQLLATDRERDLWGRLRSDLERSEFIDKFWRSRDSDAETEENEFRSNVSRRIHFADQIFPSPDERGALTDRGRVFVLLGAPARVYRQALQRGQTTFAYSGGRRPLDGQVERWIYFRPQLPGSVPAQQVEFKFITQPGYGEGVMQKEFMAMKALEQAQKATAPREE